MLAGFYFKCNYSFRNANKERWQSTYTPLMQETLYSNFNTLNPNVTTSFTALVFAMVKRQRELTWVIC